MKPLLQLKYDDSISAVGPYLPY